jgi:hypothetical protein
MSVPPPIFNSANPRPGSMKSGFVTLDDVCLVTCEIEEEDDLVVEAPLALHICLNAITEAPNPTVVVQMEGPGSHSFYISRVSLESGGVGYDLDYTTWFHVGKETPPGQEECGQCGPVCRGPCTTYQCTYRSIEDVEAYMKVQPGIINKIRWNMDDVGPVRTFWSTSDH